MFTTRLTLASLQGRLGLFISFIGLAHLGTTIAESTILRGHNEVKEGERVLVARRMFDFLEEWCDLNVLALSVKVQKNSETAIGSRLWSVFSSFSRNRQYPNA